PPVAVPAQDRGWADAPDSAPAVAVLPRTAGGDDRPRLDPVLNPAAMAPTSPTAAEGDSRPDAVWAALRRRMRDLGIDRYWIEGRPDGPARFRCVLPLAGTHAVGQSFEAEADDELQAAEAALRRVTLWVTTEAP